MGERQKKTRKYLIIAGCVLAALLAARLAVSAAKNGFIIQYGIHLYNAMNKALTALLILSAVCVIALAVIAWRKREQSKPKLEPKPEPEAVLSVAKDLDSNKLYQMLTSYAAKSQDSSELLLKCAMQLQTMDVYQAKLANLLEDNGVTSLSDTKEVLDKVEQYLCKEVRKVINLINVSDEGSAEDAERINAQLKKCYKECQIQLDQVKDFLFAMAEFLNKQGSDDTTPETLEMYKKCILDSIGRA